MPDVAHASRKAARTMRGRTHVAVGVATALAALAPTTLSGVLCAVAGGALGGWIADVDVRVEGRAHDRLQGAVLAVGVAAAALAVDTYRGGDAFAYMVDHLGVAVVGGIASFVTLCVVGSHTKHRTFTHSVAALALFSASVAACCAPLAPGFALGYATHLLLDLLNKRRLTLLYPWGKGMSLGLCRSSGPLDTTIFLVASGLCGVLAWQYAISFV